MNAADRRARRPGCGARPVAGRTADDEAGASLLEVIIALVILVIGLLGVAGLTTAVAGQVRHAAWQTDQALVAQQVMSEVMTMDFDAVATGTTTDTVEMGGRDWPLTRTVTQPATRQKEVTVIVEGILGFPADTFVTRIHRRLPLPN